MSKEIKHYCDSCNALISHADWEDGLAVYGVKIEGGLELKFDQKRATGRSGTPPTHIDGGEFCSTACAVKHLNNQIAKATSNNANWTSGVTDQ